MDIAISDKKKQVLIWVVFALSIFLITFRFTNIPKVWVDEGVFTQVAENVSLHNSLGLQTSPGNFFPMGVLLSAGYPVIFPIATSFRVFGTGLWQARLPMIIYMFLLVLLFYFFAKKRYGWYPAVLSVLGLISFAPFYGNGRSVLGEVPGLVFLVLGSLCFLYWQESDFRNTTWAFAGGLAFGMCASIKPIYLILLSVSLCLALIVWMRSIQYKKSIFYAGLGYLIPLIAWLYIQFGSWDLVRHIVPTFLHLAGNHDSTLTLWQTLMTNTKRFFTESTPILFAFLFVVALGSFIIRFFKKQYQPLSISETIIICFITLNAIAYTFGTGWYRYFFPGHALLYLLFPAAILVVADVPKFQKWRKVIVWIPVALIVFQFYHLVFLSDTSPIDDKTRNTAIASALENIPPGQSVIFYNVPETRVFLKGSNYSQYLSMGDFLEAGDSTILVHPTADYILTGDGLEGYTSFLRCYSKTAIDRYFLFKKISGCEY